MLKRTPLYDTHLRLGARLVPFAGWEMPVQYSGILDEVRAVRETAGMFDVSHMGELAIVGPAALAWLNSMKIFSGRTPMMSTLLTSGTRSRRWRMS